MRSLRLKNFRSLIDTGRIELRPLTVLVGANSSGKSSFLRFFPLLRQTYKKSAASPLLWFGPDLDFGDFSRVVRRGAEPREVEIEFEIALPTFRSRSLPSWRTLLPLRVNTILGEDEGKTYARRCVLSCYDDVCELEFRDLSGVVQFRVNGIDIIGGPPSRQSSYELYGDQSLVPQVFPADSTRRYGYTHAIERDLRQAIREMAYVNPEREDEASIDVYYGASEDFLEQLQAQDLGEVWRSQVAQLTTSSSDFRRLKSLYFAMSISYIIETAKFKLQRDADTMVYLGPFRAPPARFYRQQELSVRYMDPQGGNLAMFLRELSAEELDSFSGFMLEHVGFRVRLESEGSNISILLRDESGHAYNLVDMGYGFSQVLPVIAQCWAMASGFHPSEREPLPTLIAIEQPELHLHPHYQAKLADMFVGTINAAMSVSALKTAHNAHLETPTLLVETHSEALVSRLGELVEDGTLDSKDVQVLLFEQDALTRGTTVRQSTFSPDGTLENWPIGFFAP